jgi:hypothetical protein
MGMRGNEREKFREGCSKEGAAIMVLGPQIWREASRLQDFL